MNNTILIIITVTISVIVYTFTLYKLTIAAYRRGLQDRTLVPSAKEVLELITELTDNAVDNIEMPKLDKKKAGRGEFAS